MDGWRDEWVHGHTTDPQLDRMGVVEHNLALAMQRLAAHSEVLDALLLAVQSLENRMERVEARLAAVERATPLKRPKR